MVSLSFLGGVALVGMHQSEDTTLLHGDVIESLLGALQTCKNQSSRVTALLLSMSCQEALQVPAHRAAPLRVLLNEICTFPWPVVMNARGSVKSPGIHVLAVSDAAVLVSPTHLDRLGRSMTSTRALESGLATLVHIAAADAFAVCKGLCMIFSGWQPEELHRQARAAAVAGTLFLVLAHLRCQGASKTEAVQGSRLTLLVKRLPPTTPPKQLEGMVGSPGFAERCNLIAVIIDCSFKQRPGFGFTTFLAPHDAQDFVVAFNHIVKDRTRPQNQIYLRKAKEAGLAKAFDFVYRSFEKPGIACAMWCGF